MFSSLLFPNSWRTTLCLSHLLSVHLTIVIASLTLLLHGCKMLSIVEWKRLNPRARRDYSDKREPFATHAGKNMPIRWKLGQVMWSWLMLWSSTSLTSQVPPFYIKFHVTSFWHICKTASATSIQCRSWSSHHNGRKDHCDEQSLVDV